MAEYRWKTVSKGRANFLLKKASILNSELKPPKKYAADFTKFIEYEEEQEHNNDGNNHEENKDQNTFS